MALLSSSYTLRYLDFCTTVIPDPDGYKTSELWNGGNLRDTCDDWRRIRQKTEGEGAREGFIELYLREIQCEKEYTHSPPEENDTIYAVARCERDFLIVSYISSPALA